MSEDIELWDGTITIPKMSPNSELEAFKAELERLFSKLDDKRHALMAHLRPDSDGGRRDRVFDEESKSRTWSGVQLAARLYLARKNAQETTMRPVERRKRLVVLSAAVHRMRCEAELVIRERELMSEVAWAWFDGGSLEKNVFYDVELEFEKMVKSLSPFEKQLNEMVADVSARRGRQRSPRRGCIWILARIYRDTTGKVPGTGEGPFARFVADFFDTADDTVEPKDVTDILKIIRAEADNKPDPDWPSPFDKGDAAERAN